jgi:hypothetical protein
MKTGRTMSRIHIAILGGALALLAGVAIAGIAIEDRPVSLITKSIATKDARLYVPVVDLAKALGGTATCARGAKHCSLTVGAAGIVKMNPTSLKDFAKGRRASTVVISIGGQDVMLVDDYELVMLRPNEWALSLDVLAHLFGGSATFDGADGTWKLPHGGPGTPLEFRGAHE